MLELIVWIFLSIFLGSVTLLIRYWYTLLKNKEMVRRGELIDIKTILITEFKSLLALSSTGYPAMGIGAIIAWGIALFGGLVTPDTTMAPDFAEGRITNYFFLSAFLPILFTLFWPNLREIVQNSSLMRNFVESEVAFFFGMGITLAAINLTAWGVHHELSFLYTIINIMVLLTLVIYKLDRAAGQQQAEMSSGMDDDGDNF